MNNNSKDVVKNVESNKVESTSNEQRQTNKPIVISRRRLLRAGVAGIPVVLTMAGVAPGQSIMGQASAASGLVYGGTGVGVRERFDGNDQIVHDNLVWSNNNGFVIDKSTNELFSEEISTTDRTVSGTATITISGTATSGTVEKTVNVTAKDNFPELTFDAFLHKSGVYYTDFLLTKVGGADATTSSIKAFFEGLTVTDYFDFTIAGESTPLDTSKVTSAQLAEVSVTFDNSWTKTTGYQHGSDSATTDYYLVPGNESTAITVKFKIKATIEDVTRDVTVGENTTEPCTFKSNGSATTDEISFVFKVQGKSYSGN